MRSLFQVEAPVIRKHSSFHDTRSRRLYAILEYNWAIFPFTFAALFYFLYQISRQTGHYDKIVLKDAFWTSDCTILLCAFLPLIFAQLPPYACLWGLCLPMRPFVYANAPKKRPLRKLRVCLVTKGSNFQTVINSTLPWLQMTENTKVSYHVLVDSENASRLRAALAPLIHVDEVPKSFRACNAKYKARSLEWFRQKWKLTGQDWVLHLDEETEIDFYALQSCLDFIERGGEDIGMGTIFYNGRNHWENGFLSAAEINRIADDFGHFQLPARLFRRTLLGFMHGSFILINGAVENAVTWDTDCLAEDFWFAYQAVRRGYKFGWLNAIAREQPPSSVPDFFHQRRRWYTGIWSINTAIVRVCLFVSILAPLWTLGLPLYIWCRHHQLQLSHGFYMWLIFNISNDLHGTMISSFIQDMDTPGVDWISIFGHIIVASALTPLVNLAQSFALIWALMFPSKGFYIINKA